MVTPPSEEKVREERNRKEKKSYELREQLRRLNDEAESNERDYKQYRRKYAGEKAKECRILPIRYTMRNAQAQRLL